MAVTTSYTEDTLIEAIEVELGSGIVSAFGFDQSDALLAAVRTTTRLLGLTDISEATDMLKVETIAYWRGWLAAESAAVSDRDLKSDGDEIKMSQRWDHIRARLARAEAAASRYDEVADALAGGGGTAYVSSSSMAGSPYAWQIEDVG